jgi:hypothetical protein
MTNIEQLDRQLDVLISAACQLVVVHGYSKDLVRKTVIEPVLQAIEIRNMYGALE